MGISRRVDIKKKFNGILSTLVNTYKEKSGKKDGTDFQTAAKVALEEAFELGKEEVTSKAPTDRDDPTSPSDDEREPSDDHPNAPQEPVQETPNDEMPSADSTTP